MCQISRTLTRASSLLRPSLGRVEGEERAFGEGGRVLVACQPGQPSPETRKLVSDPPKREGEAFWASVFNVVAGLKRSRLRLAVKQLVCRVKILHSGALSPRLS
jgi:hypothetical protein